MIDTKPPIDPMDIALVDATVKHGSVWVPAADENTNKVLADAVARLHQYQAVFKQIRGLVDELAD